jgi:hypothetical protein
VDIYIGLKINYWTVLSDVRREKIREYTRSVVDVQCKCGKKMILRTEHLKDNKHKSCGCYKKELNKNLKFKHGMSVKNTANYNSAYANWRMLRHRCNSNRGRNKRYCGRGITYDPGWDDFETFLLDMGDKPGAEYSIDRIDNDKNYCKENCRWATQVTQQNNKCNNRFITFNGQTRSLSEWAQLINIKPGTLRNRLEDNWSIEKALTTPLKKNKL